MFGHFVLTTSHFLYVAVHIARSVQRYPAVLSLLPLRAPMNLMGNFSKTLHPYSRQNGHSLITSCGWLEFIDLDGDHKPHAHIKT